MKLSGSVTVLCLVAVGRPWGLAAQATGTMQVVATVTTAGPAWAGLIEAQGLARQLSAGALVAQAHALGEGIARVELRAAAAAGASAPPTIEIHYLRN